ncbi:hypothetical protein OAC89_01855 [Deltaproteobacteria bacterium]|nr:hypothetical protein [Deltaproteobacteria bacterium]
MAITGRIHLVSGSIGRVNVVKVSKDIKTDAKKALDRMLTFTSVNKKN